MGATIPHLKYFALLLLLLSGCATRSLPDFEKRLPRADTQKLRTTGYTHSESDHRKHGRMTARGTPLQSGAITSAAADWSRWPVGTRFRVRATGRVYEVDDYGWELAGTNTIDLYFPNRREMNAWGVRRVTIDILHWGSLKESERILRPRAKHKHVKRMLRQM